MDKYRPLALAGVLSLTLTAAVAMPTAASAATGSADRSTPRAVALVSAATGSKDQVAALKTENRRLKAQIASASRGLGGRGTLAHRVRILRKRLGGEGNAIRRALAAQRTVGGSGDLDKRATALRARLGGSGSAARRALAVAAILDGSGTLSQRAQTLAQEASTPTDTSALWTLTVHNQALTTQNQALTTQNQALTAHNQALTTQIAAWQGEVTAAKTTVGGSGTLADRLGGLGTLVGGSGSLTDAITAADDTLGGGGNLTDDVDNYVAAAGSTAATIVDAQSRIGGSGTLAARLDTVDSALGASGTVVERLTSLSGSILTAPTGDLTADVATLDDSFLTSPTGVLETDLTSARKLIGDPAATLQSDLDRVGQSLDATDPTAGTPIDAKLGNQISAVHATASNLSSAISAVDGALGGNDAALNSKVSSLNERLGGTGSAAARTSAIHSVVLTNPGATVRGDLDTARGLLGSSPGATLQADLDRVGQSLDATDPTADAPIDDKLDNQISAVHVSASDLNSAINTVNDAVGGSATTLNSKVSSLNARLGGTGSATERTSAIHGVVLTNPGETLRGDLDTARATVVSSPGVSLQSDLSSLAMLLNGTSSGSTLEARIGIPLVNGSMSSLSGVVGGNASSLAEQLGDPVTGVGGLSELTSAAVASNGAGVFTDDAFSSFRNATSLADQAYGFLGLMDRAHWSTPGMTDLTFSLAAPPTSLGGLVGQASSTG
jgi:hypothetical protein